MIIVSVELWPGGFAPLRRELGTLRISNTTDLARISNYSIDVLEAPNRLTGARARIGSCRIDGHDRIQSVWALVQRAAAAALTAHLVDL